MFQITCKKNYNKIGKHMKCRISILDIWLLEEFLKINYHLCRLLGKTFEKSSLHPAKLKKYKFVIRIHIIFVFALVHENKYLKSIEMHLFILAN